MIIGICCQLDWRQPQPFVDPRLAQRLREMASMQPGTELLCLDWTSIDEEGTVDAVSAANGRRFRATLKSLDLLHFSRLGTRPGMFGTLQEKWRALMEKLAIIDGSKVLCANSTTALRWGTDKRYLEVLAAKGVPLPLTRRVASSLSLAQFHQVCGTTYHVVKPANGECGRFVSLASQLNQRKLEQLQRESAELLLQPLVGEALAGEKSFIFFDTHFSHAVLKVAGHADFRSNGTHTGAKVYGYRPSDAEIDNAQRLASHFPCPLDTYRIDLVGPPGQEIIMEIEVMDPGHFAAHHKPYATEQMKFYERMIKRS